MKLRMPPGRMGRVWLERRLRVADRGAAVLEQKVRVLVEEERRIEHLASESREAWRESCGRARGWILRAGLLGGERQFALTAAQLAAPFDVRVRWRSNMGVTYPAEVETAAPEPIDYASLGDTAALRFAADAFRDAAEAAVAYGAARRAHEVVSSELVVTRRRLRAIQHRWIPALTEAAHDLDLALDEVEREDTIRSKWVADRRGDARCGA